MVGVSKMIVKKTNSHGGNFYDSQYLGNAFDKVGKPYMFKTMLKIFSAKSRFFSSSNKALLAMTGGKGINTIEIDSDVYRWSLEGAEDKYSRSIENLESTNPAPGLNNTTFRLKLDLDYYRNPEVLMGEDNEYLLEIVDGPIADGGSGYIYTVRLQGDSPAQYMPSDLMDSGRKFIKATTAIQGEYNQVRGGVQFGSTFMLEGQIGRFGQEFHVTDHNKSLALEIA